MKPQLLMSTTDHLEGFRITEYITVETSQVVIGTGPVSEMFSKMADFMGVRSSSFETKLDKGRKQAFLILEKKAEKIGANAMIGLDIDIMAYEKNRTGMMVTATMVRVAPVEQPVQASPVHSPPAHRTIHPLAASSNESDQVGESMNTDDSTEADHIEPQTSLSPAAVPASVSLRDNEAEPTVTKKKLDLTRSDISEHFDDSTQSQPARSSQELAASAFAPNRSE